MAFYINRGGSTLEFTGGAFGAFDLTPAPGQSCATGVSRFIAVGAVDLR